MQILVHIMVLMHKSVINFLSDKTKLKVKLRIFFLSLYLTHIDSSDCKLYVRIAINKICNKCVEIILTMSPYKEYIGI